MSLFSVSGTSSFQYDSPAVQSQRQQASQAFQQLGADLQSGNLSAAQSDFATLQQDSPFANAATSDVSGANPAPTAFNQLSQDLQAGNLQAAQQDYTTLQQTLGGGRGHHHHHESDATNGDANPLEQLFQTLGQDLQANNVSAAQQAYSSIAQLFGQNGGAPTTGSTTALDAAAGSVISVSA